MSAHAGFHYVYALLACALGAAGLTLGVLGPWKPQPQQIRVAQVVAPKTGAALVAAWGAPTQTVAGSSIAASLAGLSCAVYQSRTTIVCYRP